MLQSILVRGAREHNLKNVDVEIPKNQLVVITGPSGSGKSSLAFDTIYAEGQRRYVQSLSSYARQFLGVQTRPAVEDISGLSPAISIEQKGVSHNPRSTVGTVTEIYDYLRLLFGRGGTPYCPQCGEEVHRYSLDEIVDHVYNHFPGKKLQILSPLLKGKKGEHRNVLTQIRQKGFLRARVDGTIYWLEEEIPLDKNRRHDIEVVIDRLKAIPERRNRLSEAIQSALELSGGYVLLADGEEETILTEHYVCSRCELSLPEIEPRLFSFNNPYGACPACSGLGSHQYFSEELAVDPDRPVFEGALLPWKKKHYMLERLRALSAEKGWDLGAPFAELSEEIRQAVLTGDPLSLNLTYREKGQLFPYKGRYEGLLKWLERRWQETESEAIREDLTSYRTEDICHLCHGYRLRAEALAVRVGEHPIGDLVSMPVETLLKTLVRLGKEHPGNTVLGQVLDEIEKRLSFLCDVGVGYLSLHRRADTLSGGESQRIRLATQIGSMLTGVLYVLDEPTVGLHPRDTSRLLRALLSIKALGNTILVVEHDRDTMLAADYIVEMGPGAGEKGGEVIASGTAEELMRGDSLSSPYMRGETSGVVLPEGGRRRSPTGWISVHGASENNLRNISLDIPLGSFGCISGVSGSGKSTLLYEVLYKGGRRRLDRNFRERAGSHKDIKGLAGLRKIVLIDQSPIGRTPRSNPATYTGVFTPIREMFSLLPEARLRGYKPGRFSFNVRGGRCESCSGDGVVKVSMLFMPDVYVTCEICKGKRFNHETLDIRYKGKNIAEVLDMTVDDALSFFHDIPRISAKLSVIQEAGLGYIRLGQSATTLSGGEAQRVKLATELGKRFSGPTLYLLDEPTTGLHYTDVKKLLRLIHRLVDQGNTVLMIEHNLDVLASADYIIDLGPDGGAGGGDVVTFGTPEEVATSGKGYTSFHLKDFFESMKNRGSTDDE